MSPRPRLFFLSSVSPLIRVRRPTAQYGTPEWWFGETIYAEFTIAPGETVEMRCVCKFIEFTDDESALFTWDENCPAHETLPGTSITKWHVLDSRGGAKYEKP